MYSDKLKNHFIRQKQQASFDFDVCAKKFIHPFYSPFSYDWDVLFCSKKYVLLRTFTNLYLLFLSQVKVKVKVKKNTAECG